MSYRYFQFYLAQPEDVEASSLEEVIQKYQSALEENQDGGFRRAAFDLEGPKPSISVLCESEKNIAEQKEQWNLFLREKQIPLSETMNMGELLEEKFETHHCSDPSKFYFFPKKSKKHPECKGHHGSHAHGSHAHDSHAHDSHAHDSHAHDSHAHGNHWPKAIVGLVFGIGLVILSVSGFTIPLSIYYAITALSTAMTLYLGHKVYTSAWQDLTDFAVSKNTLYTISTLTILIMSIASVFFPGLPMMLESAPLILGFWHLGEAIEHSLVDKIDKKVDMRDCAPKSVLLNNQLEQQVSVSQLIPNDIITLQKGETIPADGVLLSESADLYTTMQNGASSPQSFYKGAFVVSGMRLAEGCDRLKMRVTIPYQNSFLSLVAKNIADASKIKAPIQLETDRILKYFIPGLLAVAAASALVVSLLFSPAQAMQCVVSILVSACPCALSLITPLAVKMGMKKSFDVGAHFMNGKALQAAADIDAVVFDLNGTLTKGELTVIDLNIENRELLKYFLVLQSQSEHPIAKKIKDFIKLEMEKDSVFLDKPLKISNIDTGNNSGIKAQINDETYMIGNQDLLRANGILDIPEPFNQIENGTTYLVKGSKVVGQVLLNEPLREDAIPTVQQLQALGIKVYICTGDSLENARKYAKALDIPVKHIFANASAVDSKDQSSAGTSAEESSSLIKSKVNYIEKLQAKGYKVAMVGDGGNDIRAIQKANLGIGIYSHCGMGITEQKAGMVLEKGLLSTLITAIQIARQTKQNIYENLFISLGYNSGITLIAAGLLIGVGFTLSPTLGIACMVLESTIIFANLYRPRQQKTLNIPSENELKPALEKSTTATILHALDHKSHSLEHLSVTSPGAAPFQEATPIGTSTTKGAGLFSKPSDKGPLEHLGPAFP